MKNLEFLLAKLSLQKGNSSPFLLINGKIKMIRKIKAIKKHYKVKIFILQNLELQILLFLLFIHAYILLSFLY